MHYPVFRYSGSVRDHSILGMYLYYVYNIVKGQNFGFCNANDSNEFESVSTKYKTIVNKTKWSSTLPITLQISSYQK